MAKFFQNFLADIKQIARRTEPIDELFMNTIYGIQFSGKSAQTKLSQHLQNINKTFNISFNIATVVYCSVVLFKKMIP